MQGIEEIARTHVFGGTQRRYRHTSTCCDAPMTFSVFLPSSDDDVPVLYWLSGLTCNDENFLIKAGAQRVAAELGMALVAPDTSPRDTGIDGEDESWDLGSGAGFYVNATQSPWAAHYRMFDYVADELPGLIRANFPVTDHAAISGHSMGGHGALVCALRRPDAYVSASAFAPIVNPSTCPWGEKAFTAYLGKDRAQWLEYDACELLARAERCPPLLVDQGDADEFLQPQLRTGRLQDAAGEHALTLRMQPGYDHSYYFIATFIAEHLRFHHAAMLEAADAS